MKKIDITRMSERQIAAQCIFPRISANDYFSDALYKQNIYQFVESGIGGFCVFAGDPDKTKLMISELQFKSEIPLLLCADFEFGLPMRLTNGTAFPHAMAIGKNEIKSQDEENPAYKIGKAIAQEAKSIGINWNLAPVCDINSNPKNPIINIRAFGESIETVTEHSELFIKGTQSEHVLACAKHFPGHGDTETDSHLKLPLITKSKEEIESLELEPFVNAIESKVRSIMVAHLAVPALDKTDLPASLSKQIVTGILRGELGYEGIVLTDALDMKAISDTYPSGLSAVMALNAGCDIALLPPDPILALDAVVQEMQSNEEFNLKVQNSCIKVIQEKYWCGMFDYKQNETDLKELFFNNEKIALDAAENAVSIFGNKELIPLKETLLNQKNQIAGFSFIQNEDEMQNASMFFKYLAQAIENDLDFAYIDENISDLDISELREQLKETDLFIFAFFVRARAYSGSVEISERINGIIKGLAGDKPIIAVLFGSPYLKEAIEADTYLMTYTNTLPGIAASILYLSGRKTI